MCFSPELLFQLAILVVVVIAAVALLRLLMPSLGLTIGEPFAQVIRILVWAVVCIIIIIFIWKLAICSGLMHL
jgi:hypothetical protein